LVCIISFVLQIQLPSMRLIILAILDIELMCLVLLI